MFGRIAGNIEKVMRGSRDSVRKLLAAFASGGHVLIEDFPGTGKTTLAKSLAASIGCRFTRVQFTPDLLPSDILGVSVFNQKEQLFEFRAGPVFTSILLADEINRASPRTQSALLEVMAEGQVSVEGRTHAHGRAVFRRRHAEPGRIPRHLPAARGADGPLRDVHRARLRRGRRGDRGAGRAGPAAPARRAARRGDARGSAGAEGARAPRAHRRRVAPLRRGPGAPHPRRAAGAARLRAARLDRARQRREGARLCSTARNTCGRSTCTSSPCRCSRTAWCSTRRRSSPASPPPRWWPTSCAR